nr:hypothetical protein GCM10025732_03850 [Glycomyces mayteni]
MAALLQPLHAHVPRDLRVRDGRGEIALQLGERLRTRERDASGELPVVADVLAGEIPETPLIPLRNRL